MTRSLFRSAALMCTLVLALGACKSGDDDDDTGAGTGGATATGSGGATATGSGGATGAAGMGTGGTAAAAYGDMPNATCLMATAGAPCDRCACTPNANNGCLEELTACEGGTDMMANMLCKAVIDCANTNKCSGNACTTPCMAQITAAIGYSGTAMPAPLTAATAVGTCTSKSCVGACP